MKLSSLKCSTSMLALPVLAVALATPAFAKENKSQGAANGQPFQALQAQIDANKAAIAGNAAGIQDLSIELTAISGSVAALQADLLELEDQVQENADNIADAVGRISSTETDVAGLQADLQRVQQQLQSDQTRFLSAIADLQAGLAQANADRQQLADQLATELASLSGRISANTFAIDGVLLDIVMINAELTGLTSDIMNLETALGDLEDAQADNAAAIADLQGTVSSLSSAVTTLQGYHTTTFSGIQQNVAVADLSGWQECYRTTYADPNAHPEGMLVACTGSKIMLACRPTGSDTLTLAAQAPREDVFFNTGDRTDIVHNANGVDWYFSLDWSMGFAPQGAGVRRSSADVQDGQDPLRMSWHTNDTYTPGYRCGNVYLNGRSDYEKVIYQAD